MAERMRGFARCRRTGRSSSCWCQTWTGLRPPRAAAQRRQPRPLVLRAGELGIARSSCFDACAVNGHFWLFFAATTDVEFELRVFGRGPNLINPLLRKTYVNPQGHRADAVTDTAAFPCHEVIDALP